MKTSILGFSIAQELEGAIKEKVREGYSGRMTTGFCWKWLMPKDNGTLVNDVIIGDYERPWNARSDVGYLASGIPKSHFWATDPNGINQ
jgi:hypothetical protein